jgi:hypothetical protein
VITQPEAASCRLCDGTLTAHDDNGQTYYTGDDGRTLCPEATDPFWLGHQPQPAEEYRRVA